jgi:hypothetical protein
MTAGGGAGNRDRDCCGRRCRNGRAARMAAAGRADEAAPVGSVPKPSLRIARLWRAERWAEVR